MKRFVFTTLVICSTTLFAQNKIFLSSCLSYADQGVPQSYQSCMQINFNRIRLEVTGAFTSYCSNYGDEVSYSYVSCINRNFSSVEVAMNDADLPITLSYCSNYRRDRLDVSYTQCINRNFREIERVINQN